MDKKVQKRSSAGQSASQPAVDTIRQPPQYYSGSRFMCPPNVKNIPQPFEYEGLQSLKKL